MCEPWEAFLIGGVGAALTLAADQLIWKLRIDDPVGVIPVHLVCAVWGLLSVGKHRRRHPRAPRRFAAVLNMETKCNR